MKENFPNLSKEIDIQVRDAQRVPNKLGPKRTTPRHIIIKMPKVKDKERILKAARGKQKVTYKGVSIRQQIHNYQQLNLKKQTKQTPEQEQNHRYGDHLEGYELGGGR